MLLPQPLPVSAGLRTTDDIFVRAVRVAGVVRICQPPELTTYALVVCCGWWRQSMSKLRAVTRSPPRLSPRPAARSLPILKSVRHLRTEYGLRWGRIEWTRRRQLAVGRRARRVQSRAAVSLPSCPSVRRIQPSSWFSFRLFQLLSPLCGFSRVGRPTGRRASRAERCARAAFWRGMPRVLAPAKFTPVNGLAFFFAHRIAR